MGAADAHASGAHERVESLDSMYAVEAEIGVRGLCLVRRIAVGCEYLAVFARTQFRVLSREAESRRREDRDSVFGCKLVDGESLAERGTYRLVDVAGFSGLEHLESLLEVGMSVVGLKKHEIHFRTEIGDGFDDLNAILLYLLCVAGNAVVTRLNDLRAIGIGCYHLKLANERLIGVGIEQFGKSRRMRCIQADDTELDGLGCRFGSGRFGTGAGCCEGEQCCKYDYSFHSNDALSESR